MRRSHAAIAILFGSIGSWAVVPRAVAAAVPGILSPALSIPFPETSPWLAQATSSSLSTDQQEQVDELLRQGQTRVTARDYAGAIAIYQQAAAIDGQYPRLFSGIAYLYVQQGEYSEAIAAYQRAIALDGDNLPFRYGLALSQYKNGQIDEALATYAPLIQKEDFELDWGKPAIALHNQVRGFYPNGVTTFRGQPLKIIATAPLGEPHWAALPPDLGALRTTVDAIAAEAAQLNLTPGTIVGLLKGHGPLVQTGEGLLLLHQVKPSGKQVQAGGDFVNGSRLQLGERLDTGD